MANMTYKQYVGALGEAEVLRHMLRTGASVNGLSASDTGWDLHLHVAAQPVDLDDVDPATAGEHQWQLSGRTAHVQVKRSSKKGGYPTVQLGTARGWVTGSRAGTPTFLLYGRPGTTGDAEWIFATPAGIDRWLWDRRDRPKGRAKISSLQSYDFGPGYFGWALHMWTHYAPLLLEVPELDDLLWSQRWYSATEIEDIATTITARLVSGFLADIGASRGADESWWNGSGAKELAIGCLNALIGGFDGDGYSSYWRHSIYRDVMHTISDEAPIERFGWTGAGVSTHLYSPVGSSPAHDPALALGALIRDVRAARDVVLSYIELRVEGMRGRVAGLPAAGA